MIKTLRKPGPVSWLAALLIRTIGRTLRFEVEDRCGVSARDFQQPHVWLFWHNRFFLIPYIRKRFLPFQNGYALTSPSNDGEIIAGIMRRFDIRTIRGSSNKRPAAAFRDLLRVLRQGNNVAITPDGPRGPCYQLQPGAVRLAQAGQVPLLPIHVTFEKAWRAKTWDRFLVPKPFSKVIVTLGPFIEVSTTDSAEAFEAERRRVETLMREETSEPD